MINPSPLHKSWVLTQDSFDRLLALLDEDRERAGVKYEDLRRRLVRFFEWRNSGSPEDQADETLNRVARKIAQGETVQNLYSYAAAVARLILLEALKEREKQHRAALEMSSEVREALDVQEESERRLACFEKCVRELPVESRDLIMIYYREEKGAKIEARKKLAATLGIPLNALRLRVQRIRTKLEECLGRCLKDS